MLSGTLVAARTKLMRLTLDVANQIRGLMKTFGLIVPRSMVTLTRSHTNSDLRSWGLKLREKIGFKRAAVAVARKLAVIMHAMLRSGELFTRRTAAA